MPIQSRNLHYAFNVEYFTEAFHADPNGDADSLNEAILRLANEKERNAMLQSARAKVNALKDMANVQVRFQVRYPGLMMGTGYPHEAIPKEEDKALKGSIQMGFTFDYVTGAPYYPGSSVKGVLRSPFGRAFPEKDSRLPDDMRESYRGYLKEKIADVTKKRKAELGEISNEDVSTVLMQSFNGLDNQKRGLPMTKRDIFYDAFLVGFAKDGQKKILGRDNLTPHIDKDTGEAAPTQEPKPLTMLRVMPGIVLTFSMLLFDTCRTDGTVLLTTEEKAVLYQGILEDFGIGAKTNVGYGALEAYTGEIHDATENAPAEGHAREATPESQEAAPRGDAPICKKCGINPATWNEHTNAWGLCKACMNKKTPEQKEEEKRRRKEQEKQEKAEKRKLQKLQKQQKS